VTWRRMNRASSLRKWALWCPRIDGVCFSLQRSRSVGACRSNDGWLSAVARFGRFWGQKQQKKKVMDAGDLPATHSALSDRSGVGTWMVASSDIYFSLLVLSPDLTLVSEPMESGGF
jgi:hypothetical protein